MGGSPSILDFQGRDMETNEAINIGVNPLLLGKRMEAELIKENRTVGFLVNNIEKMTFMNVLARRKVRWCDDAKSTL